MNPWSRKSLAKRSEHLALIKGHDFENSIVDVRVHTQHHLLDVFADRQTGSGFRFQRGLDLLAKEDKAALIYLNHPQTAWMDELKQLAVDYQHSSDDVVSKKIDLRLHGTGAQIIRALG